MRLSLLEWALCAALLVLAVAAGAQAWRLHSLNATVAQQRTALVSFADANKTNVATIGQFKQANAAWSTACRLDPQRQAEAVRELQVRLVALQDALEKARNSREVIYVRDPKARAWGDAAVPAAIADQLFPATPR